MNDFDSQVFDVMSRMLIFSLELAGEVDVPKRSGDFETKYKTATGTEVTVKRSPDGKFANKNGGQITNQSSSATVTTTTTTTIPVAKTFVKQFADFGDEIAKMPAKAQDVVRKAVFNSELSKGINAEIAKFVKKINDPNFTAGFNLGQRINDELAKKPFSKFGETVTAKFEEFRRDLPQKSENLRKEIVRIATDPNTGTIIAAGALVGLAGNFYLAGLFSIIRSGQMSFALLKLPNVATRATQLVAELTPEFAGKLTEIEIKSLAEMTAYTTLNLQKAMGVATVAGGLIMATVYNVVGGILTSHAGRVIMNRVKSNEASEKEALKTKIREIPENADDLYQEMTDQSAKNQETKQKILAGLREETSQEEQEELVDTMMTLALPTLSIDIGKKDEDYLTNNPQESSRIFQKVYEDASVKSLFAELDAAMAIELQAMFTDNPVPQSESQVDTLKKKIEATIAKLVKAEVAQTNSNRATTPLVNNAVESTLSTALLGAAGNDLKAKLITSDLDANIRKGIEDTSISSIIAGGSDNLNNIQRYMKAKFSQARRALELRELKENVNRETSRLATGAAALACATAGFIFGVATYATTSAIKDNPERLANFMNGFANGLSVSDEVRTSLNQLTKELGIDRTNTEFTKTLNEEISKNVKNVVKTMERKINAVGTALQE